MKLQVRSGIIIGTYSGGWYSKAAAQGKTVDVIVDPEQSDYPLAVTAANDALFSLLDETAYVDGVGGHYFDYRGCWIAKEDISLIVKQYSSNLTASCLLSQEEELK